MGDCLALGRGASSSNMEKAGWRKFLELHLAVPGYVLLNHDYLLHGKFPDTQRWTEQLVTCCLAPARLAVGPFLATVCPDDKTWTSESRTVILRFSQFDFGDLVVFLYCFPRAAFSPGQQSIQKTRYFDKFYTWARETGQIWTSLSFERRTRPQTLPLATMTLESQM